MQFNVAFALLFVASALDHQQKNFLGKDHVELSSAKSSDGVPPVSTTMKCVINLTIQYFVLYTIVILVKTYDDLRSKDSKDVKALTEKLDKACETMNYAPMLCVLFVGVRMRALQLSQGDPDTYDLPQPFVKNSMQACAWAVLVQTLMVLALESKVDENGDVKFTATGAMGTALTIARYLAMIAMYGGFSTVCYGAYMMEAPAGLYPGGTPPVSPAVGCTMNLCYQYFFVYLMIVVLGTYEDVTEKTLEGALGKFKGALKLCKETVVFAPMLCILFIGARMRALQIDPVNGNPQPWAQNCFFLCAYAVLVQLVLLLAIPFAFEGATLEKGECKGDVKFNLNGHESAYKALMGVRFVVMLSLYGGFTAVIYSVMVIENENGPTPAISPAMQCVMNLTMQFFFVYLCQWVLLMINQFSKSDGVQSAINTFSVATDTVKFCPMLCVLFIGLRLRALQITDQKGAPQGFAQQGMFLSTWAVLVQLIMIMVFGVLRGSPKPKAEGAPQDEEADLAAHESGVAKYAVLAIQYCALLALYGGAIVVVYALFVITPETANGSGALIPGVTLPEPAAA